MICSRPYTVTATPPPPFDSCWEGADQVVWSTTENCIWHTLCTQVWSHPQVVGQHVVTVVIAWGKRPVPFRTRKLRPTAPMVLHPGGCGRVGHRRTLFIGGLQAHPPVGVVPGGHHHLTHLRMMCYWQSSVSKRHLVL